MAGMEWTCGRSGRRTAASGAATMFRASARGRAAVKAYLLVFALLEATVNICTLADCTHQAFIQTDNELRYLVDGVSVSMDEELGETADGSGSRHVDGSQAHKSSVTFDPPSLDFKEHSLGMPNLQRVSIYNTHSQKSIQMFSISGNTVHFHCSFFQDKVLPPLSNTSFDVVFLAREEGRIDSLLFIHTSVGTFKYQVKGVGMPNPYRLRPFVGVRVPLNSSYAPLINMHNPHGSVLQVVEMYSSGGNLHLELPTGELDGPKRLWEIPPYETRPVMRANFVAHIESNHTSYIRIKTNNTSQEYLVLPVEVEVSSQPGLYCPQELLDFGLLTTSDPPKTLRLLLLNSGQRNIHLQAIVVAPVNEAVKLDYRPIKLPPDTARATVVATVTFDASKVVHPKQCTGRIVIKSKNNQFKVSVPYKAQVLQGELEYNRSFMRFYVGEYPTQETRSFEVTNRFTTAVVLHNVSFSEDMKPYFMMDTNAPMTLQPGETGTLFHLSLNMANITPNLQLSSSVILHTNVTQLEVPVVCYSGKLTTFIPPNGKEESIEFGTLGIGSKKDMFFTVINDNPIELRLRGWGSNLSRTAVELIGVEKGNASVIVKRHTFLDMAKSLFLKPYHYAVFRIGVIAPDTEGYTTGEAYVQTQFEQLKVPFWLRTAEGSLTTVPEYVIFDNAFPGKVSEQKLHIYSSFRHPMVVTNVRAQPHDKRFYFKPLGRNSSGLSVQPQVKNHIGMLYFDPLKDCGDTCYSGFSTSTKVYQQWALGFSLPQSTRDSDATLAESLYSQYQSATSDKSSFNVTFQLDTSEVQGFLFQAQATLGWPSLLSSSPQVGRRAVELAFPLTQIGNTTFREFHLHNAGGSPVLVQAVPFVTYVGTSPWLPDPVLLDKESCDELGSEAFGFPEPDDDDPQRLSRQRAEEILGAQVHPGTSVYLLQPGGKLKGRISFSPMDELPRNAALFLRNNLTGVEALYLRGKGGFGQFKFGNKNPDMSSPLMFEIMEKHLKDCERGKSSQYLPPNLTVKISFTARNVGNLPIYVSGFSINESPCEGYGFRVLNCHGFLLPANGSRKVDVAFTPDFTLSRVERVLQVHTSLTPEHTLNYTLVATLPPHMLAVCSQALPRPHWEGRIYYVMVSVMIIVLFAVLGAAAFESERLLKSTLIAMTTTVANSEPSGATYDRSKVLDLSKVKKSVDGRLAKEVRNGHATTPRNRIASRTGSSKSESGSQPKKGSGSKLSPKPEVKKSWTMLFGRGDSNKSTGRSKKGRGSSEDGHSGGDSGKKKGKGGGGRRGSAEAAERSNNKRDSKAEEETSSTTTEGSNPDEVVEKEVKYKEKAVRSHDGPSKPKSKPGDNNRPASSPVPVTNGEVGRKHAASEGSPPSTEVVVKSRGNRKPKAESVPGIKATVPASSSFAGDILQSSSLELPYKLKPVKEPQERGTSEPKIPAPAKKTAKVKGVSQNPENQTASPTVSDTSSTTSGRESPTQLWDQPSKKSADESFMELAAQTESFALSSPSHLASMKSTAASDTPPVSVTSPLLGSYSSVVSSNGDKVKAKVTPVGKIAPEVNSSRVLGPIGQRPAWKAEGSSGRAWFGDAAVAAEQPEVTQPPLGHLWERANNNTIMQVLQAERRQRVEEFQRQQAAMMAAGGTPEAWPGFGGGPPGIPPSPDVLWDGAGVFLGGGGGWEGLGGGGVGRVPAPPGWSPMQHHMPPVAVGTNDLSEPELPPILEPRIDAFDPFRSMSDIWAPTAPDSSDNWSSFFSKKDR